MEQQLPATNSVLVYWLHRILQDHTQAPPSIGRMFVLQYLHVEHSFCFLFIPVKQNHFFSSQSKIIRELKPSILQSSSNRSFWLTVAFLLHLSYYIYPQATTMDHLALGNSSSFTFKDYVFHLLSAAGAGAFYYGAKRFGLPRFLPTITLIINNDNPSEHQGTTSARTHSTHLKYKDWRKRLGSGVVRC